MDKTIITSKVSFWIKGVKYFLGYRDDEKAKQLSIMLSKMSWYVKRFDETKCMSFW